MIIGTGLIANGFKSAYTHREDVCIYAAGVSNSSCTDVREFDRERKRLYLALHNSMHTDCFVYFSTCSVVDPEIQHSAYVLHKLAMEKLVTAHPQHLIFRLPQVAGKTPNPHTLLNFLYAHIARSESFNLWSKARRNIIDVDDMAAIAGQLIQDTTVRNLTMNIANPVSYSMIDVVESMAVAVGKPAIYNLIERGSEYTIDTSTIRPLLDKAHVIFGDNYLATVLGKYYDKAV